MSADARARLRAAPAAPVLLGLYVAWSYASVSWARSPGDALDGANRTLLYCCVFALFAALPLGGRARVGVVAAWAGAAAAEGVLALVRAAGATRPEGHFVLGRLAAPISYPDADAAVFLSAATALLVLAARPGTRAVGRAAAAGAAACLVDLAVLCQSRGSLVALPLALLAWVALARRRGRVVLQLAVVAATVAPVVPRLLAVSTAVVDARDWRHATAGAALRLAVSGAGAAALTAAVALLERRVTVPVALARRLGRAALAAAALAVAAALVLAHPVGRAQRAWHDFTTNAESSPAQPHLLSGAGTSRYDVWRVALDQFAAHPLTGVGADNFLAGYLRDRRTTEVSRYPESVELRTLSETGLVGAALFLGFLALALRRAVSTARRDAVALACLAAAVYWLLHASTDWLWEFPALTAPALALLALAGAARPPARAERRLRAASVVPAAVLGLAAAAVLALPWIAVRETDAAVGLGASARAWSLLASAASLNPLGEQPAIAEATLAANAGDRTRERRALEAALARNPADWYPHFLLGIVAGRQHRLAAARAQLAVAHRLSPRDLVVVYARRRLRAGEPLTERQVGRILAEVNSTLTGARQR